MKRKKKRRISKRKFIPIIILFMILGILLGLLFIPSILEKKEIKSLEKEVSIVDNYLNNDKGNINTIYKYIDKDITTGKRRVVEKSIDNYLKDILKNNKEVININKLKLLSIDNINEDTMNLLKDKKDKLVSIKENINSIDTNKYIKTKDKYCINLYKKINKIELDSYINRIDNIINDIDINYDIINYLNSNKDTWKLEDKKIIFLKRSKYNEFKDKVKDIKIFEYKLVDDKEGPKIEASDITIYKGNNINIKDKVKCIDEVDGEVECFINGEYDINKVGTYSINISSKDEVGNKSDKKINLIVKEKVVYKNPYYTEVIRNQNTVIVYGLDNNNEYTKIIRVMPCSVGRSGQDTPTGTFTTSDKYRWGGLYGGVWGQYSTRIVNDILFHSVPYYSRNPADLEWEEYNKLGNPASLGCVRMAVRDVKWIYDNCPSGMTVKIYDGNLPNGVSKPSAPKIDGNSPNRGWDPTDPDSNNPWNR